MSPFTMTLSVLLVVCTLINILLTCIWASRDNAIAPVPKILEWSDSSVEPSANLSSGNSSELDTPPLSSETIFIVGEPSRTWLQDLRRFHPIEYIPEDQAKNLLHTRFANTKVVEAYEYWQGDEMMQRSILAMLYGSFVHENVTLHRPIPKNYHNQLPYMATNLTYQDILMYAKTLFVTKKLEHPMGLLVDSDGHVITMLSKNSPIPVEANIIP